jgi:glycopeptide antibiotics resistance protein
MLKPISRRLQLSWFLVAGTVLFLSLLPGPIFSTYSLRAYVNLYWVRFLIYLLVSTFPVFAWRLRTGLFLSLGLGAVSAGLEVFRGSFLYRSVRFEDIVVNFLGITAGILLAVNIQTLRTRTNPVDGREVDESHSNLL